MSAARQSIARRMDPRGGHRLSAMFNRPASITEVVITSDPAGYRQNPPSLFVGSSDDGSAWNNQRSISSISAWAAGQIRTFDEP